MRSKTVQKPINIKKAVLRPVRKNTLLSGSVKKVTSKPVRKYTSLSISTSRNMVVRQKLELQKLPPWLRELQKDAERFLGGYELKKFGPLKTGLSMKASQDVNRVRNVSSASNDDAVFVSKFFASALLGAYPLLFIDGTVPPGSDSQDPLSEFIAVFSLAIVELIPQPSKENITKYIDLFNPILSFNSYDQFKKQLEFDLKSNGIEQLFIPKTSYYTLKKNIINEYQLNNFKERLKRVIIRLLDTNGYHNVNLIGYETVIDKKPILSVLQKHTNNNHRPNDKNTFYQNQRDTNWVLSKNYSDHKTGAYKLFHLKKGYVGECNGMVMIPHSPGAYYNRRVKSEKVEIKKTLFLIPSLILI